MSEVLVLLKEKWLWIIICCLILIFILPFFIVMVLLTLPEPLNAIATLSLIILWGVVAGYKDWLIDRKKETSTRRS